MAKFVWHNGDWREVVWRPRGPALFPSIHRDSMPAITHPGSLQTTDSPSEWRRWNRQHGYDELGNDEPDQPSRPASVTESEVAEAYQMLEQGYQTPPAPDVPAEVAGAPTRMYGE